MGDRLEWETDGQGWPHREASRFVQAAGIRWHVQEFIAPDRQAPVALLIHGTGSSTHSWRGLAPLLAQHLTVYAMDLPGHGFTSMPAGGTASAQFSLPAMAQALRAVCSALQVAPDLVGGH